MMFHTLLAASALVKTTGIFNPQPPKNLGNAKAFQDVQGNLEEALLPDHKNLKHSFSMFSIIPNGIQKCI